MYKVRFHLAKGEHFRFWQITNLENGNVQYVNPDESEILMWNIKLVNNPKVAQKILEGENKTVCAWIECEDIKVEQCFSMPNTWTQICYNPRKCTHWYTDVNPSANLDNLEFSLAYTENNRVYVKGLGLCV